MAEVLMVITGLVIASAAIIAFQRTRDPLAAMVIFSPMLIYFYSYHPLVMLQKPEVEELIGPKEVFTTTALVNLLGVTGFCIGCAAAKRPRNREDRRFQALSQDLSNAARSQVYILACVLGTIAVGVFWFLTWHSGGFAAVFMKGGKPFLRGIGTGYFSELQMLSFPAMLLLAVARQGRRFRGIDFLAYLFVSHPQIIWATLGGRRGPMFLLAMTLAGTWLIVRARKLRLASVIGGVCALGLLILFLAATRQSLFLGSQKEFDFIAFTEEITTGTHAIYGDEFICGYGVIEASHDHGRFFWGHRFLVQLFIRPIPRQLWPTKYRDTGLDWMEKEAGSMGFSDSEWLQSLGFVATRGSSVGFVADLFAEFSWGCVIAAFGLGYFYSFLWKKWYTQGGFWALMYFFSLILSVYLVAQSVVSAWGYRMILLGVPTWLIWKQIIEPGMRRRRRAPVAYAPAVGESAPGSATMSRGLP